MHNIYNSNGVPLYTDRATSIIAHAGDVQLYVSSPPRGLSQLIQTMERSLAVVATWVLSNTSELTRQRRNISP